MHTISPPPRPTFDSVQSRTLSLLILLLLFSYSVSLNAETSGPSPTGLYHPAQSDPQLSRLLVGTWTNAQKGFVGTATYKADGTWECDFRPEEFLAKLVASPHSLAGTWKIKEGLLYTVFTRSDLKSITLNTPYRDELLRLDTKILETRNQKGMVTTFSKK